MEIYNEFIKLEQIISNWQVFDKCEQNDEIKNIADFIENTKMMGGDLMLRNFRKYRDNGEIMNITLKMMKSDDISTNLIKRNEFI